MVAALIAISIVVWLFVLLLCLGLARAAAHGDLLARRAVAERLRRRHHRPAA
jgi:hypothetical protein